MSIIKKVVSNFALFILPVMFGFALVASPSPTVSAAQCGDIKTAFDFACPANTDPKSGDLNRSPVFSVLLFIMNLLSIGVGIAVTGFIIWGAIMYITAGGSSDQVQKGIAYIRNAIIGLILYIGMYAIANYLIPGGVFS